MGKRSVRHLFSSSSQVCGRIPTIRQISSVSLSFNHPFPVYSLLFLNLCSFIYPKTAHKTSVANTDITTTAHLVPPKNNAANTTSISVPAIIFVFFPKQAFSSLLSSLFSLPTGAISICRIVGVTYGPCIYTDLRKQYGLLSSG